MLQHDGICFLNWSCASLSFKKRFLLFSKSAKDKSNLAVFSQSWPLISKGLNSGALCNFAEASTDVCSRGPAPIEMSPASRPSRKETQRVMWCLDVSCAACTSASSFCRSFSGAWYSQQKMGGKNARQKTTEKT